MTSFFGYFEIFSILVCARKLVFDSFVIANAVAPTAAVSSKTAEDKRRFIASVSPRKRMYSSRASRPARTDRIHLPLLLRLCSFHFRRLLYQPTYVDYTSTTRAKSRVSSKELDTRPVVDAPFQKHAAMRRRGPVAERLITCLTIHQ